VAASVAQGETVITGAEELRVKESDRIATMSSELRAMGALIIERPDGMVIQGSGKTGENGHLKASPIARSHGDHRVAMSLAVAGLTANTGMMVDDAACVQTSFPDFESKLSELLTACA